MDRETRNELHRLAQSQRSLFSAAQALELGISYDWLARAAADGYLRRPRRGVYAIAARPPSRWEPMLAAALAVGPEAVISHSSAASAHRLACATPVPALLELTVPMTQRNHPSGVQVHRSRGIAPADLMIKHGVLITTPARTLVDLAGRLEDKLLAHTVDEGMLAKIWRAVDLSESLSRAPANQPGRQALTRLLGLRMERPSADSFLEVQAFEALRPLLPFQVHYPVTVGNLTYVLDAAWPLRKVGAEVVGRSHRVVSRSAFDRERRKLNELAAAGWRIAHLTAAMSAEEMVQAVRSLLHSRQQLAGNEPLAG